jgi:hypothetical protein
MQAVGDISHIVHRMTEVSPGFQNARRQAACFLLSGNAVAGTFQHIAFIHLQHAGAHMGTRNWDFDTLLTNGWHAHWEPQPADASPIKLVFTYYRSELTVHAVTGEGPTRDDAIAEAVARANAWLQDYPGYQPRDPWITA